MMQTDTLLGDASNVCGEVRVCGSRESPEGNTTQSHQPVCCGEISS
jgi:hypothetical protein